MKIPFGFHYAVSWCLQKFAEINWYKFDPIVPLVLRRTRRERPKSAPYLRLKNIQGTTIVKIWKKKFFKKIIFEIFSKKKYFLSRKMPEKIQRGDPLGTSGCVCFLEKVKTERGTLWSKVCLLRRIAEL